jgi:hypothetical protein
MAKCNIAIPPEMAPDLMTIFQNGSPRIQLYTEMGTELLLERDQVPRRDLNLCVQHGAVNPEGTLQHVG